MARIFNDGDLEEYMGHSFECVECSSLHPSSYLFFLLLLRI